MITTTHTRTRTDVACNVPLKEIGLQMSGDNALALLAHRKFMTRRMKGLKPINENPCDWNLIECQKRDGRLIYLFKNNKDGSFFEARSPYGVKDDLLWVKETWYKKPVVSGKMLRDGADTWADYYYHADEYDTDSLLEWGWEKKSSMFMPKSAARIWLQNTSDPYPQRLLSITEKDCVMEGIERYFNTSIQDYRYRDYMNDKTDWQGKSEWRSAMKSFKSLWSAINGPDSLEANPWVWVVSFDILSVNGKPKL